MRRLPAFLTLALLAACQSQVPIASTYDLTFQQKMQAAHHWQVLAEDIVTQVTARAGSTGMAIAVEHEGPQTTFATAFDDMLVTAFVQRGVAVRTEAGPDTLVLRYKTQIIAHDSAAFVRPPPGSIVALTAGVLAVRQVLIGAWGSNQAIAAAGVAAVGADLAAGSITDVTRTEMIVTTSLLRDESYVARYTDIYYLPDDDVGLYQDAAAQPGNEVFTITYDSWARSLSDVRTEADARCQNAGLWASLIGRDFSQRVQSAQFRCYRP